LIRLNKYIACSGITARRKADELISSGRVTVNGKTVTAMGIKIDPATDVVKIDGVTVIKKRDSKNFYILLNKPRGYITSTSDEKNRKTVLDLIDIKERIYPVGRLDYDSEGLLILTNDGELTNRLMHPRYGAEKTYVVKLNRAISQEMIENLKAGIKIDGIYTAKAKISVVPYTENKQIKITIHEGRNRQVRKMLESVGLFVRRLKRTEYAGLKLKGLRAGEWRYLTNREAEKIKSI
jgi:pseudouridine synthase